MAALTTYWFRFWDTTLYYIKGMVKQLEQKDVFIWSQAIAFKVLVTIVPLMILATGLLGEILESQFIGRLFEARNPLEAVAEFTSNFLPPAQSQALVDFLTNLAGASRTFTFIGVLGLLLSGFTLFTTLRITVSNIFQEDWHENRSILGGYLFDFRMVLQVGLLFLVTIGLSFIVKAVGSFGVEVIEQIGLDWLLRGWQRTIGLVIPFVVSIAMFFQLYYFVPKLHPPRRSALIGAIFSAVIFELTKNAFTIYAANIGQFNLGDTFGIIIAFVFWVYLSGVVLCLGALVTLLHETKHRGYHGGTIEIIDRKKQVAAAGDDKKKAKVASQVEAEPNGQKGPGKEAEVPDHPQQDLPVD